MVRNFSTPKVWKLHVSIHALPTAAINDAQIVFTWITLACKKPRVFAHLSRFWAAFEPRLKLQDSVCPMKNHMFWHMLPFSGKRFEPRLRFADVSEWPESYEKIHLCADLSFSGRWEFKILKGKHWRGSRLITGQNRLPRQPQQNFSPAIVPKSCRPCVFVRMCVCASVCMSPFSRY